MTTKLTHKLEHDKWKDRWSCVCGYVLGTGRDELYAQCPKAADAYIEFDITTTHETKPTTTKAHIPSPPKRQVGRRVARIHRKGQSLFDS